MSISELPRTGEQAPQLPTRNPRGLTLHALAEAEQIVPRTHFTGVEDPRETVLRWAIGQHRWATKEPDFKPHPILEETVGTILESYNVK